MPCFFVIIIMCFVTEYCRTHTGAVSVLAFEAAVISLSTTKMEDKHKGIVNV